MPAKVTTDGAMVFKKPTFESDVIAYLKMGLQVKVTRKIRSGFHKVKLPSGVIGYIRIEDVRSGDAPPPVDLNLPPPEEEGVDNPFAQEDPKESEPFWMRRYAGPLLGIISYSESLNQKVQSTLTAFGLKLTGPDILIDGPLIDMNIVISSGAPKYYSTAAGSAASGFLLMGDYRFLIPVSESADRFMYVAAGPVLTYTNFKVDVKDVNGDVLGLSMQQLNLGLTFGGGLALRAGKFAVRAELNAHIEINRYFSFLTALQYEF